MYTLHEALARERMQFREQRSRQQRLVVEVSAARRWHSLERRVQLAQQRHAHRADRAARLATVVD